MKLITLIALALLLIACADKPTQPAECTLWVERTVPYGDQEFKKLECAAWQFGPSLEQQIRFRDHMPPADRSKP